MNNWAELGKNPTMLNFWHNLSLCLLEVSNKIAKLDNEFFSANEHFPCLNQISMPNVEKYKKSGWWKTHLDHKSKENTGKKL